MRVYVRLPRRNVFVRRAYRYDRDGKKPNGYVAAKSYRKIGDVPIRRRLREGHVVRRRNRSNVSTAFANAERIRSAPFC